MTPASLAPLRSRAALLVLTVALGAAASCGGPGPAAIPRLPEAGPATDLGAASTDEAGPARSGDPAPDRSGAEFAEAPALTPRALPLPPIHRFELPGGLPVILVRAPNLPVVSVALGLRAGRRDEPRPRAGLASVAAAALLRGAGGRSRLALDALAERAGASLSASAGHASTVLGCRAVPTELATCVGLLADAVVRPALDEARVTAARREVAAGLRRSLADGAELVGMHLDEALWGPDHPRGWSPTTASLERISAADVEGWHRARVRPGNAVLVVVADVEPAALAARLRGAFAGWRPGSVPDRSGAKSPEGPAAHADPRPAGLTIRVVDVPGAVQGHLRIGRLGIDRRAADLPALTVLDRALGAGAASRLGRAVRDRLGPASAATSTFDRDVDRGAFVVAGVAPSAQLVGLMRLALDEVVRLGDSGPSARELAAARTSAIGALAVALASPLAIGEAAMAAALAGDDLATERDAPLALAKVSAGQAREVARRRLAGQGAAVVLLGDGKMIARALDHAGLRYERVAADGPIARDERVAAAATAPASPAPGTPADRAAVAAARKLLDATLAAKGGAARLGRLATLRWKGDASLTMGPGQTETTGTVERQVALPDRLRLDMHLAGDVGVTTILAGGRGWAKQVKAGSTQIVEFPPEEVDTGRAQLWRDPELVLLRHLEPGSRVVPEADVILAGVTCRAVRVASVDGKRAATLLIDPRGSRGPTLVGLRYGEGGQHAEERLGDHRRVGGVLVAHRRETRTGEVVLVTTLREVTLDPKLDPAVFARPPQTP